MSDDDDRRDSSTSETSETSEEGPARHEVRDEGVEALDAALSAAGTGEVVHFADPKRTNASSEQPPVWSIATVAIPRGTLYLTYGLSEAVDPGRTGHAFELSIAVCGEATTWPALLLRALARYMLQTGRELLPGQYMPFPAPLTRFFVPTGERPEYPETDMAAAYLVPDPVLGSITTPSGEVRVRRVVGIYPDELEMIEPWSIAGWIEVMADRDPGFLTDIARPSHAADPEIAERVEQGARKDGSDFPHVAVRGVTWSNDDDKLLVGFPGGRSARRIHRMLQARLNFGRPLLVHDVDPSSRLAVAFQPSQTPSAAIDDEVLVLSLSPRHPLLDSLNTEDDAPITWNLG